MRVLVTGGTGVVGRPAVEHLLAGGHTVRLFSRHAAEDARQWAAGVEARVGSVGDAEDVVGAAAGCEAVLHVAGVERESPPEVTFERVNVEGTRLLLEEARRSGVRRFVYVSSLGAERGASGYHRSKRAAEELVRGFPGEWLILRPGNVYGQGDRVISLLLEMVRMLPAVPIVGDGDQPFQPVWADDLGRALARAVESDRSGEALPLAGAEVTTVNGILDRLAEITGKRPARIPVPSLLAGIGASAMQALGIDPPVDQDQLVMLAEENVVDPPGANALTSVLGVEPVRLEEGLRLLADAAPEALPGQGVGSVYRQRYSADILDSPMDARGVMRVVREEFAALAPEGLLDVGSEPGTPLHIEQGGTITMDIPLRGTVQVRVEEVTPESFTMATLSGHHLAGVIRFGARDHDAGRVRFEITSFTRAGSWFDEVARKLGGKLVQKSTWQSMVENVVERVGGRAPDGVRAEESALSERDLERVDEWARELVMRRMRDEGMAR